MTSDHSDFVVLHPDGQLAYGYRNRNESTSTALSAHIDNLGTQGLGAVRAWHSDNFRNLSPNPLADHVFALFGYRHPTGWRGTVALTMEENHTGECPPLSPTVRAKLNEFVAKHESALSPE